MENFLIQSIEQFGYLGILLLIAIENIFPPIPSEIILTFGGFMTTYTNLGVGGVIFFATLGSLLGAIGLYGVGRLFTPERLDAILNTKLVRLLGFKHQHIHKAIDLFAKKGKLTVLFARCVPVVRSLISIPAGIAKMPFGVFLLYTTVGTIIWNTILVTIGAYAGASWHDAVAVFDEYSSLLLIAFIVIIGILGIAYYVRSKKEN